MAAVAAMILLETRSLCKSFGGLAAVNCIDFTVNKGEIHAVIGPNGAGKTTFVSLIAGRMPPDEGQVFFAGIDVTRLPDFKRARLGIAYTFQITSIFSNLTASQNVAIASGGTLGLHGVDALRRVRLEERKDQVAGTLSYGHQRLLEVAMGLALNPRLLILDEPTQGLSDTEITSFIALVRDIAKDATVLLIEHNMKVVMELAHCITVLHRGKILAQGTPDEIRANSHVRSVYLGNE
jgi:branched-chain amino acid transport system ATP-binding protein